LAFIDASHITRCFRCRHYLFSLIDATLPLRQLSFSPLMPLSIRFIFDYFSPLLSFWPARFCSYAPPLYYYTFAAIFADAAISLITPLVIFAIISFSLITLHYVHY